MQVNCRGVHKGVSIHANLCWCRVHVPSDAWQNNQAMTVDTNKGAIDLEPPSGLEYAMWVLGLNAAITTALDSTVSTDLPVDQMLWSPELFVMSN